VAAQLVAKMRRAICRVMKRLLDIVGALLGLVALSPVFLLAAALIKLNSRGPLFFTQERIGQGGAAFRLYKFRTMNVGAESAGTVSVKHDARVFRGANFLRKFKIDELPQLLNVLNGTMSLVGPRPTVREDYERMDAAQRRRTAVRPGLTGLAQINGNTGLSWPARIKYDLLYVDEHNLLLDIGIMANTVWLIVRNRVETHPAGDDEWAEPNAECGLQIADLREDAERNSEQ
jgi:lipopolysaccharide/colanic/teichoic acid biosynthesis glycosyltransferase